MKKILLFAALFFMIGLQSCIKDELRRKVTIFRPVFKTKMEVRNSIISDVPMDVKNPGKLFYKDGFVFLNELNKGIHIIDIKNPSNPTSVAFVKIPGNVDMAVRGNILYADLYTDLVAIDISNPRAVKLTSVNEGVFQDKMNYAYMADSGNIIVDWISVDTVMREDEFFAWGMRKDVMMSATSSSSPASSGVANGTGGSMARFALSNDRMYTVDNKNLKVFNTSIPEKPVYVKQVSAGGWDIETIFPFGNNLFIGSMTGMYIFDISTKDNPVLQGTFVHARVCDPVISDGKFAYVTLRNGSMCRGFENQLDVVDIADLKKPALVKSYKLTNPHGLSKDGTTLIICDGKDGVKFFDASKASDVKQLAWVKDINAFDVIAVNNIAIVSAVDALYLIDYSNPANPLIKGSVKIKN